MSTLVHEGFGIRRNPLTGELVSFAPSRTVEPNSRLRSLTANAEPLDTEQLGGRYFDDAPTELAIDEHHEDASSPLHVMVLPKALRRNLVVVTDEEQQDLGELHQRLAELISTTIESPAASFEVLWSMVPFSHGRSISRMREEYTSAGAGVNFEESPEELAHRLKALL